MGVEAFIDFPSVPLYLSEADVTTLLEPADAVEAIEACFRRQAAGEVEIAPRRRLRLPEGALADMAAADSGLGFAGGKLYAATAEGATFVVCLFDSETSALVSVIEGAVIRPRRRWRAFARLYRRSAVSWRTAERPNGSLHSASARVPSPGRAIATPAGRTSSSRSRTLAILSCEASGSCLGRS